MIYHSIARCVKIGFKGFWWNDMKQIKKLIAVVIITIIVLIMVLTSEIVNASNPQGSDSESTETPQQPKGK